MSLNFWTLSPDWSGNIHSVDPSYDAVHFNMGSIPSGCQPGYPTITDSTPGVTKGDPVALPGGGFKIVMTWENRPCVPNCIIPFTVESGVPGQTDVSSEATLRLKVCPVF